MKKEEYVRTNITKIEPQWKQIWGCVVKNLKKYEDAKNHIE